MATHGIGGDALREFHDVGVVGEDEDLSGFAEFRETFERGRFAGFVEVDEHVVDDDGHGAVRAQMFFDAGETHGQEELVAGAVGQTGDFDAFRRGGADGQEKRFALLGLFDEELLVSAAGEAAEVGFRFGEHRVLLAFAETLDRQAEHLAGQVQGGIFGGLVAKLGKERFDRLLAVGGFGTGLPPEVDLPLGIHGRHGDEGRFLLNRLLAGADFRQAGFEIRQAAFRFGAELREIAVGGVMAEGFAFGGGLLLQRTAFLRTSDEIREFIRRRETGLFAQRLETRLMRQHMIRCGTEGGAEFGELLVETLPFAFLNFDVFRAANEFVDGFVQLLRIERHFRGAEQLPTSSAQMVVELGPFAVERGQSDFGGVFIPAFADHLMEAVEDA